MPLYYHMGPGQMVEQDLARAKPPELTEPTAPVEATKKPVYLCKVDGCGRSFTLPAIFARHFNKSHEALAQTSDSWREHYTETYR